MHFYSQANWTNDWDDGITTRTVWARRKVS